MGPFLFLFFVVVVFTCFKLFLLLKSNQGTVKKVKQLNCPPPLPPKQERRTDEPADKTGDKILIQPSSSAPHPGANKGIGDCHADGQKSAPCPLFGAVLHTR